MTRGLSGNVLGVSGLLPLGLSDGSSDRMSMTILFTGVAVIVAVLWMRMRVYRNRFNRAMKAMDRGGLAQRAAWTFWKAVGTVVLLGAAWLYVKANV